MTQELPPPRLRPAVDAGASPNAADPKPQVIDIERHNDKVFVYIDGELVCTRDEKTNTIAYLDGRLNDRDKKILEREVWSKLGHAHGNRATRRWNARAMKKRR